MAQNNIQRRAEQLFLWCLRLFGKKKLDRAKLARTVATLKVMENRLRFIEGKLERGIEEKMQEIIKVNELYGKDFAMQIAAELAERKKVLAGIKAMRVSVERVRVKFETMLDLNTSIDIAKEVLPLVSDLKKSFTKAAPEISIMFTELEERLNEMGIEIGSYAQLEGPASIPIDGGAEVDSILREASEVASAREKGKLPSPP